MSRASDLEEENRSPDTLGKLYDVEWSEEEKRELYHVEWNEPLKERSFLDRLIHYFRNK